MKGLIIGYSTVHIKNKVKRDITFLKQLTSKKLDVDENKSEGGRESNNSSLDGGTDVCIHHKHVSHIIGDGPIPQNETWVERLASFVKDVYENQPHVKILGCQFGSQIIAYALGGSVAQSMSQTDSQFVGKENIDLKKEFFK